MLAAGGSSGAGSSLAAEVLQLSGLLAQDGAARAGADYIFSSEDNSTAEEIGTFELSRDDTLELIGLLNSQELEIARREFGSLLPRLERRTVEGLTQRLYAALRRQRRELVALEYEADKNAKQRQSAGSSQAPQALTAQQRRAIYMRSLQAQGKDPLAGSASPPTAPPRLRRGAVRASSEGAPARERPRGQGAPAAESGSSSPAAEPPAPRAEAPRATGARCHGGLQASAYLEAVIEAYEAKSGNLASTGRHGIEGVDTDPSSRRSPRVSEEKASEIFDRLYKSGKDHRVRRRVYQELGSLVDQAKHEQTCTFVPNVPFAAAQSGSGSVTERLYRDGVDRRRRREEMSQNAPVPTFHPRISTSSVSLAGSNSAASLHGSSYGRRVDGDFDSVGAQSAGFDSMLDTPPGADIDAELTAATAVAETMEPRHSRLFREHEERRARQQRRQEQEAEWRKHSYRPDIRTSQASGPSVMRQFSTASGMSIGESSVNADVTQISSPGQQPPQLSGGHGYPTSTSSLAAVAVAAAAAHAAASGASATSSAATPGAAADPAQGDVDPGDAGACFDDQGSANGGAASSQGAVPSPPRSHSEFQVVDCSDEGQRGYVQRVLQAHEDYVAAMKADREHDRSFEGDSFEGPASYGGSAAVAPQEDMAPLSRDEFREAGAPFASSAEVGPSGHREAQGSSDTTSAATAGRPPSRGVGPSSHQSSAGIPPTGASGDTAALTQRMGSALSQVTISGSALAHANLSHGSGGKESPVGTQQTHVAELSGFPSFDPKVPRSSQRAVGPQTLVGPDGSTYTPYMRPPSSGAFAGPTGELLERQEVRASIGSVAGLQARLVSREASLGTFHSSVCATPTAPGSPPTRAYSGTVLMPATEAGKLLVAMSPRSPRTSCNPPPVPAAPQRHSSSGTRLAHVDGASPTILMGGGPVGLVVPQGLGRSMQLPSSGSTGMTAHPGHATVMTIPTAPFVVTTSPGGMSGQGAATVTLGAFPTALTTTPPVVVLRHQQAVSAQSSPILTSRLASMGGSSPMPMVSAGGAAPPRLPMHGTLCSL